MAQHNGKVVLIPSLFAFAQTCRTMSLVGVREQPSGERVLVDDVTGEVLAMLVPSPALAGWMRELFLAGEKEKAPRQP